MSSGPSPLEIAKERLRIPKLWELRGWPGKPGMACRFPDGTDKNPSASVFRDGRLLRDFRSDKTYDAPGLLGAVENLTPEAACRLFIALAGVTRENVNGECAITRPSRGWEANRDVAKKKTKADLPHLECGTEAELEALAALRSVSVDACRLATARGFLWFADSGEGRAWIVTDRERWNATARRLDGHPWKCLPSNPKARTLRGSWASWPIGLAESEAFAAIAITEGAPDFLAAFHFALQEGVADQISPLCMAGAGLWIPSECLPAFHGKRIRIFVHDDKAGRAAFERWAEQIQGAGGTVDGFDFSEMLREDGSPVGDLNDLCHIGAESLKQWGSLVESFMSFAPTQVPVDTLASVTHQEQNIAAASARMLTPSEVQIIRDSGLENDPLTIRALELFDAQIITHTHAQHPTHNTTAHQKEL